jgi:hypothetical protein
MSGGCQLKPLSSDESQHTEPKRDAREYVASCTDPLSGKPLTTAIVPDTEETTGREVEMERVMGIEPTPSAWEAEVLPLNYTRPRLRTLLDRRPGAPSP